MRKTVRRTLATAAMTGVALLGTGAPALAGQAEPAAPAPDLGGLTTLLGPAAETGKASDIAPAGVPVAGLLKSGLGAPEKLGLPKLPEVPGLGS